MIINMRVGKEILPGKENDYLIGVNHPCFYNKMNSEFSYERRENSTAYIPYGSGKSYFQGCISGGRAEEYLIMSKEIQENIDIDLKNEVVAIWHDESHLNKYFLNRKPKILPPSYAYPESMKIPFRKQIIQLDKSKYGGHDFFRN
jgi:Glycosyltransferase family 6